MPTGKPIELELVKRLEVPGELKPFAFGGVEIRKKADLRGAIRFLRQKEQPELFEFKIPRIKLDIITKEVGEGIGFGEVTTKGFRSSLFDLRFIRFGPQRVIAGRRIEEPKLLEGPRKKVVKKIEEELKKKGKKQVVTFDMRGIPVAPVGFRVIEGEITDPLGRVQIQLTLQKLKAPGLLKQQELVTEQLFQPIEPEIRSRFPIVFPITRRERIGESIRDITRDLITEQDISRIQEPISDIRPISDVTTIQDTFPIIDTTIDTTIDTVPKFDIVTDITSISEIDIIGEDIIEEVTEEGLKLGDVVTFPKRKKRKIIKVGVQGFNTLIKRKLLKVGKERKSRGFARANKEPLTQPQAINLGAKKVDNFANRSFKIKKSRFKAKPSNVKVNKKLLSKFRKKKDTFIEKTKFAIDSPQEKRQIPFEAARLRRIGAIPKKKKQRRTVGFF